MEHFYYNVNLKNTKNKHKPMKSVLICVESAGKVAVLYVDSR